MLLKLLIYSVPASLDLGVMVVMMAVQGLPVQTQGDLTLTEICLSAS